MNTIRAIFYKQISDFPKNFSVSLLYILFPAMAFVMGNLIGNANEYAGMFAAMYVGAMPMIAVCHTVAEDSEYKSLRFLVMAGVKPSQYLFGLAGFVLLMSLLPLGFFMVFGEFSGARLINFAIISILGVVASVILGAAIGVFSKNVQQATAIYTPVMMAMALMPAIASVNETLERIAGFLFPYQVLLIALHTEPDLIRAFTVTVANIVVLMVVFIFAYKKKGLRG